MSTPTFDHAHWDALWTRTLRTHADVIAHRRPNPHLTDTVDVSRPGRALDAGCGHGAETLWLAAHGWQVTAVDFSAAALAQGRAMAAAAGADIAARVVWTEADLGIWVPERQHYDLVVSLYVHIAGAVEEMVRRLAGGVAPGGHLLMAGHRPVDPATGVATAARDQVQVSVDAAVSALDPADWALHVAHEVPRAAADSGVDALIHAQRRQLSSLPD